MIPASPFSPMYVFPVEYKQYGLPTAAQQPDIDNLVQLASTMIDEHCGRTDGNGLGSLAYSTYQERLVSESLSRNIYYLPKRPIVAVTQATIDALEALDMDGSAYGVTGSFFNTGCLPSINTLSSGSASAVIAASGRYAYGRRSSGLNGPWNLAAVVSPIGAIGLTAGPAQWIALSMSDLDYDTNTGEIWFSDTSIIGVNYNEVIVTYNSGYDPRTMPKQIKLATAALTKNLMAKGSGTTGMTTFSANRAGVSAQFSPEVIDVNICNMLRNFVTVRAY